jgi:predicted alpha/beta superfamily hydrolase
MSSSNQVTSSLQPGIEVRPLHSDIVNQDFLLYIKLPWRYHQTDTAYPVLIVPDADRSFFLYSTISLIYETPPTEYEEVVIVGIGYGIDNDRITGLAEWAAWRTRDLTPVRSAETERLWEGRLSALMEGHEIGVQSGGAPRFLESLRKELIPFMESNYRLSSTDRGLAGYSYGGLFTLYSLFHAPDTFKRFFAGSPTMWDELFEYEEDYAATHDDLDARLLMTAGGLETDLHEPFHRMVDRLRSRRYPRLAVQEYVFEEEDHESAYATSVSRALRVFYGRS